MITIRHLSYTYKKSDRKVLNDLCADFEAGKIQVLIGKNGSGKTTLFDLIAGVTQRPKEIVGVPHDTEILYKLQGLLFPNVLKGKDLFRFYLHTDHSNKIKVTNTPYTDSWMNPSEMEFMERAWNTPFGQLSVGERRFLSILAATLMKRKLYIFDEPTSGVDPEARIRILRRIELLAQAGRIVLLSSHTLHDFQKVDCKIHLLNQGRFTFEGTYDQFVKSYSDANPDDIFAERLTQ